jgi:hypothetical protein
LVEPQAHGERIPARLRDVTTTQERAEDVQRADDDRLMAELGEGEIWALEQLYDRYSPRTSRRRSSSGSGAGRSRMTRLADGS